MSFRIRIAVMTVTIIAVLFSVGGAVMIHTTFKSSLEKEEESAVNYSRMVLKILQMVEKDKDWFDEEDLIEAIENISEQDTVESVMLLCEKEPIYQKGSQSRFLFVNEGEMKEHAVFVSYFETEDREPYLQTSVKIILSGKYYYLSHGRSIRFIYDIREEQIAAFQKTFFVLLLLGSILSWCMATLLTNPLRRLQNAAKEIAMGNLSYRSNIQTEDEIGSLARDFDQMAEKLEGNIRDLHEASEQKDRFMGAFTHELKTPLTSVIGYAELLRTQTLMPEETEDALDYIYSEAKRLENMSFKMLDIFVADKLEMSFKAVDLKQMVSYMVDHIRPSFERENVSIEMTVEEGACCLDEDLVQALLLNLLDNGKKAMKHGGVINLNCKMTDEGCQIIVKDEGKGIPKEALAHLTEAFYRVDKARSREQGSAGLGLALCDKIVKLHSGTMTFESQENVGTTVTVNLKGGR